LWASGKWWLRGWEYWETARHGNWKRLNQSKNIIQSEVERTNHRSRRLNRARTSSG